MKVALLFPFCFLLNLFSGCFASQKLNGSSKSFGSFANLRTVLFTEDDHQKPCWSIEELNLLAARRIVQDLVPQGLPRDFQALRSYVQKCIEKVQNEPTSRIMKRALFDALGGYLHSVAIPVLNNGFYAGKANYKVVAGLHGQLAQMMAYLKTDGGGWIEPCDMSMMPTKIKALPLKTKNPEDACQILSLQNTNENKVQTDTKIPLPFLDDDEYPSAIAVPLKDHPLFSLVSECSVEIIPKYYILAMSCLKSNYETDDIINFNHHLHKWIITKVVPHLGDSRWFPGFGGVLRVVETMKQKGLASSEEIKLVKFNRTPCDRLVNSINLKTKALGLWTDENDQNLYQKFTWTWKSILLLLGVILFISWLIYCIIWMVKIKIKKRQNKGYVTIKGEESTLKKAISSLNYRKKQPKKEWTENIIEHRPPPRSNTSENTTEISSDSDDSINLKRYKK